MKMRQQLELSIEPMRATCRAPRRRHRAERARWWFEQMRRVVSEAPDRAASAEGASRN
jgi:hypothetical protein